MSGHHALSTMAVSSSAGSIRVPDDEVVLCLLLPLLLERWYCCTSYGSMCQGTFERVPHAELLPLALGPAPELLLATVALLELLPPLSSRPLSSWVGRSLAGRVISTPAARVATGRQQQSPLEAAQPPLLHALLILELAAAAAAELAAAAAAPPALGGGVKRDCGRPRARARATLGWRLCWRSVVRLPPSWDGCARQYPFMVFCAMTQPQLLW